MKKILIISIILIIAASMLVLFRKEVGAFAYASFYYSPCDTPIAYSVGTIDSQFKITKEELLGDLETATSIWSGVVGQPLFEYDPNASFTINMVYDERQKLTSKITELNSNLEQKQGEIDPKIAAFKEKQSNFEKRVNTLNDRISYWNSQGGAPREEYEKLVAEQKQLQIEASSLNQEAEKLGQATQEYNANANTLNRTIDDYKQVLEFKPEEGLYEQDGNDRKISIFIDVSEKEFLHTLTHELGHALALDHINDREAIMYPQTTDDLTPSIAEITMLQNICKKRPIYEVLSQRIQEVIEVLKERAGRTSAQ